MNRLAFSGLLFLTATVADAGDTAVPTRTASGRITDVHVADGLVTLRTADGQTLPVHIGPRSRLQFDGRAAKLDDFKAGTRVIVTYDDRNAKHHVVEMTHGTVTGDQVKQEVGDALRAVKDYTYQQRGPYEAKLNGLLSRMQDRIEELQDRAGGATGDAKQQLDRAVVELRAREKVVRQQLDRVRASSADAWDEMRVGIGRAFEDLRDAVERARTQFK